ncbi:MAG: CHASE domain-containing protein, partial [Thermomonas sp.]
MTTEDIAVQRPSHGFRWRFGHSLAILTLVLSSVIVLLAWNNARERELKLAETQFHAKVGKLASLVQLRMTSFELTQRGGASLFAAVDFPTAQQWHNYAEGLSLKTQYPALLGLGFSAFADQSKLMRLQLQIRESGGGLLDVRPHGRRERYAPIIYLEPRSPENLSAIGFDMFSKPVRRRALQESMASGEVRLSGVVSLVQDTDRKKKGMLLFTPVYRGGLIPTTPAQRREAMVGWVYSPFHVDRMLDNAIAPARGSERMRVVDVTDPEQVVLYADPDIGDRNTFTESLTLNVHGRRWRFDFFSGPGNIATPQLTLLSRMLVAGGVVSLLLFGLMWTLASIQSRAERIAREMTDSFRRSEQRFRSAMKYSAIGKALLDTAGNIVEANPALEQILGRSQAEMLGRPFAALMDPNEDPRRTAQMDAVLDEEGQVVRTMRSVHRLDGEVRNVQLTIAPVPGDRNRDIARLVQVDDVTDRVRAEGAVKTLNRTLESRVAA